jgi:tyrosyl-tRNA synthetase
LKSLYEVFLQNTENNPRDLKLKLAKTIVEIYHGEQASVRAEKNFIETFQKGGIPDSILEISINEEDEEKDLSDILVLKEVLPSKSEWKRLIDGGSIKEIVKDGENIKENILLDFKLKAYPGIFKIGKKKFIKIII